MTDSFFHEGDLVGVLTAQPLDRVLDYKAPEGGCHLGAFVEVPLGPRKVLGVVWSKGQGGFDFADLDTPLFLAENPFDGGFTMDGGEISVAHLAAGHGVTPKR